MKRLLLALLLTGCVPYTPLPQPRPQPNPQPQPQPQPQPLPASLEVFQRVKVGDDETATLEALPKPTPTGTKVGDLTIRAWETNVNRPSGGHIFWEQHYRGGKVVASFPW